MVGDQGCQRLALGRSRLAIGEAGGERLGQHPADRPQRRALDLAQRAVAFD